MERLEKIKYLVKDYNALAEKKGIKSRLMYREEVENLYLGREVQLEYGSYECILAKGLDVCIAVASSLNKQLCFEEGE